MLSPAVGSKVTFFQPDDEVVGRKHIFSYLRMSVRMDVFFSVVDLKPLLWKSWNQCLSVPSSLPYLLSIFTYLGTEKKQPLKLGADVLHSVCLS